MPLDPYFTRNGAKHFTCFGDARTVYSPEEQSAIDQLTALPEKQRGIMSGQIADRVHANLPVTRIELGFYHVMRNRSRARRKMPLPSYAEHVAMSRHSSLSTHH